MRKVSERDIQVCIMCCSGERRRQFECRAVRRGRRMRDWPIVIPSMPIELWLKSCLRQTLLSSICLMLLSPIALGERPLGSLKTRSHRRPTMHFLEKSHDATRMERRFEVKWRAQAFLLNCLDWDEAMLVKPHRKSGNSEGLGCNAAKTHIEGIYYQ
jgi:hypothetical protein